jgi:hypothetical protein
MHRILRGLAALVAFGGVYTLLVGALTYLNAVVFGLVGRTYADAPWQGWLQYYWPFFALAYAPAAALRCCRPGTQDYRLEVWQPCSAHPLLRSSS